jgi:hypothetical protein
MEQRQCNGDDGNGLHDGDGDGNGEGNGDGNSNGDGVGRHNSNSGGRRDSNAVVVTMMNGNGMCNNDATVTEGRSLSPISRSRRRGLCTSKMNALPLVAAMPLLLHAHLLVQSQGFRRHQFQQEMEIMFIA